MPREHLHNVLRAIFNTEDMGTAPGDITGLLADVRRGDRDAEARLAEVVYDHLHNLPDARCSTSGPDHTLQPTVLVHEADLAFPGWGTSLGRWRQVWRKPCLKAQI